MPVTPEQLTAKLHLVEGLEDAGRMKELPQGDLDSLRAVSAWIKTFVAVPHRDLGRAGPVCPFVPGALARNTLWLAAEHVTDRSLLDVAALIDGYQRRFNDAQPTDGDAAIYKSFVIVFTDLPADRAGEFLGDVLKELAVASYAKDGFVMGGFHERNEGPAIYNASFRPFTSPVPFLLMRQAVVDDWKFFVDDDAWLARWALHHGGSGAEALGRELRRLPWKSDR